MVRVRSHSHLSLRKFFVSLKMANITLFVVYVTRLLAAKILPSPIRHGQIGLTISPFAHSLTRWSFLGCTLHIVV